MQEIIWDECAGELERELNEIEKAIPPEKGDAVLTQTLHCGQFLTIYCC